MNCKFELNICEQFDDLNCCNSCYKELDEACYTELDDEEEECGIYKRCEECTYCARTKPCECGDCNVIGGTCEKQIKIYEEKEKHPAHKFFEERDCAYCRTFFDAGKDTCKECGFDLNSWNQLEECIMCKNEKTNYKKGTFDNLGTFYICSDCEGDFVKPPPYCHECNEITSRNRDDYCKHGVCDGKCCICTECQEELQEEKECEECGTTKNIAEYWWIEAKNEKWVLCEECGEKQEQEKC
jgi:hypothetical protein